MSLSDTSPRSQSKGGTMYCALLTGAFVMGDSCISH